MIYNSIKLNITKYRETFKSYLDYIIPIFFICLFYISPFYSIPFFETNLLFVKRLMYLALILMLICSINFKQLKLNLLNSVFIFWVTINLFNYFYFDIDQNTIIVRISQIMFIFALINYSKRTELFSKFLNFFSSTVVILALCLIIVFLFYENTISFVLGGFGNSRTNFSIWLLQLLILQNCYQYNRDTIHRKKSFVITLILSQLIFFVQLSIGGRIGIVFLIILFLLYCYWFLNWKYLLISIISFIFTFYIYNYLNQFFATVDYDFYNDYNKFFRIGNNMIYSVDLLPKSAFKDVFLFLNNMSSSRLDIFIIGLLNLNFENFFIGEGIDKFWVSLQPGNDWQIHNLFLKSLLELGVIGLLSSLFISLYPIYIFYREKLYDLSKIYLLYLLVIIVYFLIANLQPAFILTQISNCIIYWVLYSCILDAKNKI